VAAARARPFIIFAAISAAFYPLGLKLEFSPPVLLRTAVTSVKAYLNISKFVSLIIKLCFVVGLLKYNPIPFGKSCIP